MFRSILSFFKMNRMESSGLDPAIFVFDPNVTMRPSFFLYTLITWASAISKPEDVVSGITVKTITYTKKQETPEHEWLVIETVDRFGKIRKFIMDRVDSKNDPAPDATSNTTSNTTSDRKSTRLN